MIPGPYYNQAFFKMIAHLKSQVGEADICQLSLKEIYRIRLDANVLADANGEKIPLPIERVITHIDWNLAWRRIRAKGIDGDHASTLLLALHDWLPTYQRVQKMSGNRDPLLHHCRACPGQVDNIFHSIVQCVSTEAANILFSWVKKLVLDTTIFDIIYLQVNMKHGSREELAITMITALSVHVIWQARNRGGLGPLELKSEVLAANSALLKTKYSDCANIISTLVA